MGDGLKVKGMQIAICQKEEEVRRNLFFLCELFQAETGDFLTIFEFSTGTEFLRSHKYFDILFMELGGIQVNGIQVKKELALRKSQTIIIFITENRIFGEEVFGRNVWNYLLQPISKICFFKILEQVLREYRVHSLLNVGMDKKPEFIWISEIFLIKSDRIYTQILRVNGIHYVRKTLQAWTLELERYHFFRINKSYLINLAYVECIENEVVLKNGLVLKISRKYREELLAYYEWYCRKELLWNQKSDLL